MPNNRKTTLKKIKGRESVHPGSRKAAQISRVHHRKAKLVSAKKTRKDYTKGKLFRPLFFMSNLQSAEPLSLPQLRALVAETFIGRNDERIAELVAERRAGRPKVKEHLELEELRAVEEAEYHSGFEVIDLTDAKATRLLYTMIEQKKRLKPAHVDLLPHIRIFRDSQDVVVSRPGKLQNMGLGGDVPEVLMGAGDDEEDDEEMEE